MGSEINFLNTHPGIKRDYEARVREKTPEIVSLAKEFGRDFFDGDRKCGYGGYNYDVRWKAVVERIKNHYYLPSDASILDIGCGKGFLLHDFKEMMPECVVSGLDVSEYAITNSMDSVRDSLKVASAE